jgi:hypothetical protein
VFLSCLTPLFFFIVSDPIICDPIICYLYFDPKYPFAVWDVYSWSVPNSSVLCCFYSLARHCDLSNSLNK